MMPTGILASYGMSVWDFTNIYTSQSAFNGTRHRYYP